VLLYLKKSRLDKSGKALIMGRITVNRSMVQFSCKLSCTPNLWNPRESRLNGKSNEAVETNAKLDKLLLSIHTAFDTLVERKTDFDAESVKNLFQGILGTQMTLLGMVDIVCEDLRKRIGIDHAKGTYPAYIYTRRTLAEFIEKEFNAKDLAFGQMTEQFIHDYQSFILDDKGLAIDTCRHYLAIVKKVCRKAYKDGYADRCFFAHFSLPQLKEKTPKALSRNLSRKSVTWQSPNTEPPISWQEICFSLPAIRELPTPMPFPLRVTICLRMTMAGCGLNTSARKMSFVPVSSCCPKPLT